MKKIRIIDVANHASVSKSTVSQYLNGRYGHMSLSTKQKIQDAIKELNYVPNAIARSLKSEKTKTVGVVVRDIAGYNTSHVIRGIDDYCKQNNYNVLIYNSDFDANVEQRALLALQQMCVDGIIITSSGLNSNLINEFMANGMPVIQFQLEYEDCPGHIVVSDYKEAAFQATEHLINLGHQRICFVAQEFSQSYSRQARYQGYLGALNKYGIQVETQSVLHWSREEGFAKNPLTLIADDKGPTAFFSQHLAITTDLLKLFNAENVVIPEDVSLLGFDEIPMVELFKVPVSVIKQDAYQIGYESGKLALEAIQAQHTQLQRIVVPCTLISRASCKNLS
ncbi:LacI family DNA-binding transcriptional regulator [Vibrio renipiscarius]|uniref:LacI family transcriptional regulator n=1 Tax=Vibrio renipiscarius TaxID=1461322 RepID=A0A0C2NHS2_9VIBR|nr:LacI family DNA-binding transcriptional regulator [Vibrio renipiscarius]KII75992.1 LacI family transcriptional regulator [Vibrio renipiscarius]KII79096.1 LacI family transcriptional regulator [Vibrio renipiscarius]